MKNPILFFCATAFSVSLSAQDPSFTQFYASPLYLNPAFAGTRICPGINLSYRNQWPGISGDFVTSAVSFDKKAFKLNGGIGFVAMNDRAGEGTLVSNRIGAIYSYHQQISKKYQVCAAIGVNYAQKHVNRDKLTFGDMIDPKRGFVFTSADGSQLPDARFLDFDAGILAYGDRYYAGFAVHHLFEPNESVVNGTSILPRKFTAHAGANIPLSQTHSGEDTYISPNILFQRQGDFTQLNLGLYLQKGAITGGIWYRDRDSFILLLGFQKDLFRIGYSYDVTVSKLSNATAGSHELSLGISFKCKPPSKRYRPDFCPSF